MTAAARRRMVPCGPVELARCNGTILVEHDGKLGLVELGGGWIGTAIFVAILLAVIPGVGGAFLITVNPPAGLAMVAIAAVAATAAVLLIKRKRRSKESTAQPTPWLVFDLTARVVRNSSGAALGSLDQVRLERVFQAGSSSKALAVFCPSKIVIARGTPFGDEVDQLERTLRSRGIGA